jgi:lipoic acid synthetase
MLRELRLHTVCEEAGCPNRGECFGRGCAAFMILGRVCTRGCRFCCVEKGNPAPVDADEPENVARAVELLGLGHVVLTSVTRDDLPDGGAAHFAAVIRAIRHTMDDNPPRIEVLIPDFMGDSDALLTVLAARPDIINHNIETVPRLYSAVRPEADYRRSLELLGRVKDINPAILTKSGIMVGLGETFGEVLGVFADLRAAGCELLTVGQYLAPSRRHYPVAEYIRPEVFEEYKRRALEMGFLHVESGSLVRSSYMAERACCDLHRPG